MAPDKDANRSDVLPESTPKRLQKLLNIIGDQKRIGVLVQPPAHHTIPQHPAARARKLFSSLQILNCLLDENQVSIPIIILRILPTIHNIHPAAIELTASIESRSLGAQVLENTRVVEKVTVLRGHRRRASEHGWKFRLICCL